MKRWSEKLFGVAVVFGILGTVVVTGALLVSATGIIPVKASSRHWAITEWFLHFSMRRSVATHSLGVKKPELDDPALILRGATHYDVGCRSCHGSPGTLQPRIAYQMTPPPPGLKEKVREWSPEQLFSIIKHGVKFTGMPAWPARERDDEVWSVVAFLWTLPDLDEAGYLKLIGGEAVESEPIQGMELSHQSLRVLNQSCVRCHGADGLGRGAGAFPVIAGQREEYLEKSLQAYASGGRHSGIMGPIAAALKPDEMRQLSAYYAQFAPGEPFVVGAGDPEAIERGRILAQEGERRQRIPACVECHTPDGRRTKPAYPILAGQPASYLITQLELFSSGSRGGSEYAHIMNEIAPRLTSRQIQDVAAYFSSLRGSSKAPSRTGNSSRPVDPPEPGMR